VLQVLQEIEQLKVTLEESQELRRRKIAYDEIADKINELPSRAEQERRVIFAVTRKWISNTHKYSQIATLLAEVAAIKEEQEAERRIREERQGGLAELNRVLDQLRIVGKGAEAVVQDSDALVPEVGNEDVDMPATQATIIIDGEMEEGEEREGEGTSTTLSTSQARYNLSPYAAEFQPRRSASTLLRSRLRGEHTTSTPGPESPATGSPAPISKAEEDIEMEEGQTTAEVKPTTASAPHRHDELEEGETHSSSSPLTSVGDD
jgi:THO complex subunit 7